MPIWSRVFLLLHRKWQNCLEYQSPRHILETYNSKQSRADRRIDNYYEEIRTSKQEKLFHELIVQIGNRDDTNCDMLESVYAQSALEEYMMGFQERNPNLWVFNAVMHLDEETPHLHIDYVPFSTGNKRGLGTKVSLKGALKAQGFVGTGRFDTEWKRWVESEKQCLAEIMQRYQMKWLQKGTHEKHLSVYDYEKKMRKAEVEELEQRKSDKVEEVQAEEIKLDIVKMQIQEAVDDFEDMQKQADFVKEQAMQQYEKYRRVEPSERGTAMFDDMLRLKQENMILKDENRSLKEKLQKAYDFMKQFTINGLNMLERFLESIGEGVHSFSENIGFGGRNR